MTHENRYQTILLFFKTIKLGVSSEKWLPPLKHSKASTRGLEETVILLGKKMTDSGFIYAIKAKKQPYVKIGLSADPFQRIRNLQPGSPYKLQVAQTWEVHNMKASEDLAHEAMEEYILRRHEDNPYETEWFEMPEGGLEKVDEIVSGAISEHISGKTTKYDVE